MSGTIRPVRGTATQHNLYLGVGLRAYSGQHESPVLCADGEGGESTQHNVDALWTARQAAAYLSVHLNTLERLTKRHGLPFYRIGTRDRRFRREEIDAWLRKRRT